MEFLPDVQYAFGLPFDPHFANQYMQEEKTLSLAIMQYLANFVRSGCVFRVCVSCDPKCCIAQWPSACTMQLLYFLPVFPRKLLSNMRKL